jgi:hypothetical protein
LSLLGDDALGLAHLLISGRQGPQLSEGPRHSRIQASRRKPRTIQGKRPEDLERFLDGLRKAGLRQWRANFRFWLKADIRSQRANVRFWG